MRVVHYTKQPTFELRPITIKNSALEGIWCKPDGGLWASPLDSKFGWQDWCQAENFRDTGKQLRVILDIDMESFITINSRADLSQLPWHPPLAGLSLEAVDFEKLVADGVVGVYLTEQGQWATRFSFPRTLYGWDCESILILNERCIKHYRIVKDKAEEMAEGYQAMAAENRLLAEESLPLAWEEWPYWEETADPYTWPKRRKDSEG